MSSVEFMSFARSSFDENEQTRKNYVDIAKEHNKWINDDEWMYGVTASVEESLSSTIKISI